MENFVDHIETLRAAPIRILNAGTHSRRELFNELNLICVEVKTLDEANQGEFSKFVCTAKRVEIRR